MRTLTRKLAIIEPNMLLVGIDLAADKNVAIVINQQAKRLGRITFSHTQLGYQHLRQRLAGLCQRHGAEKVLVGMEPTNYYWKLVAANLETHGITYRLVNAYTVKKHREGDQLDRAKDDDRDGFGIADLLRTGKFTETQRLQGKYAELRQYSACYDQLRQEISRHKIRLRQAVGQTFPELGQVFKDLTGQTAQALLQRHAAAHHIRQMRLTDFLAAVRADYDGCRLQRVKLRQTYQLAQESVGLTDTEALQWVIQSTLQTLAQLQSQWQHVRARLVQLFGTLPAAPALLSLGLGDVTTARIMAEIGDPTAYTSARQLVKLAGIQPSPNQSGRKVNSPTPMSGKGRARLRTATFFACLRKIQTDAAFAAYYQQLQHRPTNPLTGLQAIGVLMRKLLHILWSLWRTQSPYDPTLWRTATGV
jgi:transposase